MNSAVQDVGKDKGERPWLHPVAAPRLSPGETGYTAPGEEWHISSFNPDSSEISDVGLKLLRPLV